jgi:hypothetical protein
VAEEVGRHCLAHDAQAQEPHLHLCCLLPPSPALFSPKLASAHGKPRQALASLAWPPVCLWRAPQPQRYTCAPPSRAARRKPSSLSVPANARFSLYFYGFFCRLPLDFLLLCCA